VKILIVDDSKAMRMIVRRTVKKAGFTGHEFVEAGNGAEGLRMIESENPDLVLSDWNMPRMNGLAFLKKIQEDPSINVKFGFVTSEGTADMREKAAQAGALFLVCKPFTVDTFRDALTPLITE